MIFKKSSKKIHFNKISAQKSSGLIYFLLNCYFYARHKLKLVKICNLSVVYITIANCASIPACDQRERADNGAIATPYRARATLGSVGESERGGSRASKVNERQAMSRRSRGGARASVAEAVRAE